jgi:uncharacterized protein YaeQ
MRFISGIFKITIQLSKVEAGIYETLKLTLSLHESETEINLYSKILSLCHAYTYGMVLKNDPKDIKSPDLYIDSPEYYHNQGTIFGYIGCPDSKRIRHVNKQASVIKIYFYQERQIYEFCQQLRGAKENWVENIEFYLFKEKQLIEIATEINSKQIWSVTILDQNSMFCTIRDVQHTVEVMNIDIWEYYQLSLA